MATAPVEFEYPTYVNFVKAVYGASVRSWQAMDGKFKRPGEWLNLIRKYGQLTVNDIVVVFIFVVIWSCLREFLTNNVFKPIARMSKLKAREAQKAPESAWKLLFYMTVWSYSSYILFFTKHNFFHDPPSAFDNWNVKNSVPGEIYIAYVIQFSFYIHSIYATLYIDVWRKDSVVMMLHHVVTSLLIGFSYTFRYTNVGILVLFLHDVTDICLEMTKLLVYYKSKGGRWESVCDALSTVGFVCFGITWFLFRLYWFPLKALYAAGYASYALNEETLIFYHLFNGLLWTLLFMNIYWFHIIVVTSYKIVTGQMREMEDTREKVKEEEKQQHEGRYSNHDDGFEKEKTC